MRVDGQTDRDDEDISESRKCVILVVCVKIGKCM